MLYVSKVNIQNNTARAKHIRSLIVANRSLNCPLEFVFYNFKRPFNNLNFLKKLLFTIFFTNKKIYTRDIEYALIASIFRLKVIFEIHHFGLIRNSTKYYILKRFILYFLSKSKFVRFVVLTHHCGRALNYLYPNIGQKRIYIIPDAGFLNNFINKNKVSRSIIIKDQSRKITLAYAGSFLPGKGGLETIYLADNLKQYQFNLAGNLDQNFKSKIQSMDNITFFGYLNDNDLNYFYQQSDILLAPIGKRIFLDKHLKNEITFYTSPLKLYEYFFTGKPIITFDRPCTRSFRNMPGVWFVKKDKENCFNTWNKLINEVNFYISKIEENDILKLRQNYRFTWQNRINEMIRIK